jgi:hypothetical protein
MSQLVEPPVLTATVPTCAPTRVELPWRSWPTAHGLGDGRCVRSSCHLNGQRYQFDGGSLAGKDCLPHSSTMSTNAHSGAGIRTVAVAEVVPTGRLSACRAALKAKSTPLVTLCVPSSAAAAADSCCGAWSCCAVTSAPMRPHVLGVALAGAVGAPPASSP